MAREPRSLEISRAIGTYPRQLGLNPFNKFVVRVTLCDHPPLPGCCELGELKSKLGTEHGWVGAARVGGIEVQEEMAHAAWSA